MSTDQHYCAAVCTQCRHVVLISHDSEQARCARCDGDLLFMPGASFTQRDAGLFMELEGIVRAAELSRTEATLMAAELASVGARWEPPDLVLAHISPRLEGLNKAYDAQQEYPQLLLVVGMLLTILGTRLVVSSASSPPRLRSDVRGLARTEGHAARAQPKAAGHT